MMQIKRIKRIWLLVREGQCGSRLQMTTEAKRMGRGMKPYVVFRLER
jgi:hypothetical protein